MRKTIAAILFLSTLLAGPALAQEQQQPQVPRQTCMAFDRMKAKLAAEYQEVMANMAMSSDGTLVAVFTSKDRTFTVVKVSAGGPACVVDFGKEWQVLTPEPDMGQGL
jgi:hypothetical protein